MSQTTIAGTDFDFSKATAEIQAEMLTAFADDSAGFLASLLELPKIKADAALTAMLTTASAADPADAVIAWDELIQALKPVATPTPTVTVPPTGGNDEDGTRKIADNFLKNVKDHRAPKEHKVLVQLIGMRRDKNGNALCQFKAEDNSDVETSLHKNFFTDDVKKQLFGNRSIFSEDNGVMVLKEDAVDTAYFFVATNRSLGVDSVGTTSYRVRKPKASSSDAEKTAWANAIADLKLVKADKYAEYILKDNFGAFILRQHLTDGSIDINRFLAKSNEAAFEKANHVYSSVREENIRKDEQAKGAEAQFDRVEAMTARIMKGAEEAGSPVTYPEAMKQAYTMLSGKDFNV